MHISTYHVLDINKGLRRVEKEDAGGKGRGVTGNEGDGAVKSHGFIQLIFKDIQSI